MSLMRNPSDEFTLSKRPKIKYSYYLNVSQNYIVAIPTPKGFIAPNLAKKLIDRNYRITGGSGLKQNLLRRKAWKKIGVLLQIIKWNQGDVTTV